MNNNIKYGQIKVKNRKQNLWKNMSNKFEI